MERKYALALLIGNGVRVINISQHNFNFECIAASQGDELYQRIIKESSTILEKFLYRLLSKGYDFLIVSSAGNQNNYTYYFNAQTNEYYLKTQSNEQIYGGILPEIKGGALAEYNSTVNAITQPDVREHIVVVGAYGLIDSTGEYYYANFSNVGSRVDIIAPGVEICSTIPNDLYDSKTGTSMAAPHVSGAAALLYSVNPRLSGKQVKEILMWTASDNGIADAYSSYYRLNAGDAVELAMHTAGEYISDNTDKGILLGVVKNADDTSEKLKSVEIKAVKYPGSTVNNVYKNITATDVKGEFDLEVEAGTYDIWFYKDGFLPMTYYGVSIEPYSVTYLPEVYLVNNSSTSYSVYGYVKNAVTSEFISGAKIKIRSGWNKKTGEVLCELSTDQYGYYKKTLPQGNYTVECSKGGLITNYTNVVSSQNAAWQNVIMSPVMGDCQYSVVLSWGYSPEDLDAHCIGTVNGEDFHVYFENKNYIGNNMSVNLDVDDVHSYGPETITINTNNCEEFYFKYYVYDFTNRSNDNSGGLSLSCASVSLYRENQLVNVYHVPIGQNGLKWDVFEIRNGELTTLNTIT